MRCGGNGGRTPRLAAFALLVLLLLGGSPAAAQERIGVRVGDHPTYGRVVFDWPNPPPYAVEPRGEGRVLLRFGTAGDVALDLGAVRRMPRNVLRLTPTADGLEVTFRPGATVRHFRLGARVVLDVVDQAASVEATAASRPTAATDPPRRAVAAAPSASPAQASATSPAPTTARAEPSPTAPAPPVSGAAPASPVAAAGVASAVAASPARTGPAAPAPAAAPPAPPRAVPAEPGAALVRLIGSAGQPRAALLPFGTDTGLAVFRRGDTLLAVFDTPRPLDLAPLRRDPVLSAMTATVLPEATVLSIALPPPAILRARRVDGAWALEATRSDPAAAEGASASARPVVLEPLPEDQLLLRAAGSGRVVAIADPETGLPILVGPLREPAQALLQPRRLAEGDLPATLLGAVVLARSDRVVLRSVSDGFVLATVGAGARLALDPLAVSVAAPARLMTRLFQIPSLPLHKLTERLRAEQAAIAGAPPLARLDLRRAAAETMLALGLPQEAQAVLALARREDPAAATDPVLGALIGAAAVLAGRPAEAEGLEDPRLPERDEVILWRAALAAARGQPQAAAPGLAATLPLALAYPEGLRHRLLPLVAEAATESGARAALAPLVAVGGDRPEFALARAMLAEADGKVEEAIAGYDAVAAGRDRRARARALRRSVELRLAAGMIDNAQAARGLEATLFAWRGDEQEIATRIRLAELRRIAGDARGAMALLRETAEMFPERGVALQAPLQDAFFSALEQEPPIAAVALFDAHPEMLPAGDSRGPAAAALLAERLIALDLPDRAAELLDRRLRQTTEPGVQRATLGLRLAALQLDEGGAAPALTTLAATDAEGLPPALVLDRTVLAARADARRGDLPAAVGQLRALGPAAAAPLSELMAEAQDWAGSAAASAVHLRATLPPAPAPLDEAQRRSVLRQAALLALAGDDAGLATLRAELGPRMADGPLAEAFAALTADPTRGLADLPRLQRELQLFRRLPGGLEPLRTASLGTR